MVVDSPVDVNFLAALVSCLGRGRGGRILAVGLIAKSYGVGVTRYGVGHARVRHRDRRDRGEGDKLEKVAGNHDFEMEKGWGGEGVFFLPVKGECAARSMKIFFFC